MSWPKGRSPSIEHRAKLAEALRGNRNNSGLNKGVPRPAEVRLKVSLGLLGHQVPKDVRAKISLALQGNQNAPKGRKHSAEECARMSIARQAGIAVRRALKMPGRGPDIIFGECAYCGKPAGTWDHILPRCRGGTNDPSNLVPACRSCNSSKNDLTPEEWFS